MSACKTCGEENTLALQPGRDGCLAHGGTCILRAGHEGRHLDESRYYWGRNTRLDPAECRTCGRKSVSAVVVAPSSPFEGAAKEAIARRMFLEVNGFEAPFEGDLAGPYVKDPRDAEIARLKARVDELLEHSTALRLELRATDRKRMVREFHAKFDQVIGTEPKIPDDAAVRFRMRLTAEEFFELVVATYGDSKIEPWRLERLGESLRWVVENCPVKVDLPAFVDAHVDLGWILEGTCVSFGVDSTPMWREVARSNMAKSTGEKRGDGKIQKPEGWVGPDIEGSLKAQGWRA